MYHMSYEHTSKAPTAKNGKTKKPISCVKRFRYITRTKEYANHKDHAEKVEYVKSGNMPSFCKDRPDQFWEAAELYERKNGRTATSIVLALPKELTEQQRIELTEKIIEQFCNKFNFPYTAAIHNHKSAISGQDQPHLHLMFSERALDEFDRTAEQFFKRYNDKNPQNGGARKVTADFRGDGQDLMNIIRAGSEVLINESLEEHAPTKIVTIKGIDVEVPNVVSCLSHNDYNKLYGTNLKEVPMIPKSLLRLSDDADPKKLAERDALIQKVQEIRDHNNMELYGQYYYAALQKQNEAKKQQQQDIEIERVSASDLAYRLDLITYQATADKVKQIRQLAALQDDKNIKYIEAIEHKASLLNDVLMKENRKEVSALVNEIYKHDLETIQQHCDGRSMSYDEKRISERLNERISTIEHILHRSTRTEQKVENTRNDDDLDNTFSP
ncbi:MobA/MobL family protein [Acinetobacter junii]|uniref:MobA/MobL family protein n=1 Tax=Acinetobacter junii TaxID=40215 RepID=UPI0032B3CA88